MRLENTWQEIRDHSFTQNLQILQMHSSMTELLLSSPHSFSIGFRSEDWNGQQKLGFVLSDPFCVVFKICCWIIVRLEDPNMAHYKISNRVSHLLIFYLLVFDRIHDAMCLNKMSRTFSKNIGPRHQKYSSIFIVHMGYFYPCVHQTHLECLLLKSYFFFICP